MAQEHTIVVAGSTGELGRLMVTSLLKRGAHVRALVRASSKRVDIKALRDAGAEVREVDYGSQESLVEACEGAYTVISVLSGLEEVIVGTQLALLDAAVIANVKRFIPSDFAADFTHLPPGENRNFDWRKIFRARRGGKDRADVDLERRVRRAAPWAGAVYPLSAASRPLLGACITAPRLHDDA